MAEIKTDTHCVIKWEDTNKYLTIEERKLLVSLIVKIEKGRIFENKNLNSYWIVNKDGPYSKDILNIILDGEDKKNINASKD